MYSAIKGLHFTEDQTFILPSDMEPLQTSHIQGSGLPKQKSAIDKVIHSIQQQCLDKGLDGLKGLSVLFRQMDRDYSKTLTFREVRDGFKGYQIEVSDQDIKLIFHHFDHDNSGAIDFREFLLAFTPGMSQRRIDVVHEAFDKLDHNKDGVLKTEDLMGE